MPQQDLVHSLAVLQPQLAFSQLRYPHSEVVQVAFPQAGFEHVLYDAIPQAGFEHEL